VTAAARPRVASRRPAPSRLGRPRDGDSSETRERLLLVARQAFARNGYDATTNKEIADAAQITTGAIYHYYSSKADLYVAVYEEVQATVYGAFGRCLEQHTALLDRFSAVLDVAVELNRHDPSLAGFVVGVAGEVQRHPDLAEMLRPLRTVNARFLSRLVGEAAQRGELAPDVASEAIEDLFNAVLSGLARFSNQTGDSRRHANAADALKRVLAGSLVRPAEVVADV
jgi:AcrR family transcriptional regulator